jgi:hypothetical protein
MGEQSWQKVFVSTMLRAPAALPASINYPSSQRQTHCVFFLRDDWSPAPMRAM